jgi:hypothetical protein
VIIHPRGQHDHLPNALGFLCRGDIKALRHFDGQLWMNVRAWTGVSVTTWAVCPNTKEPGDGSAESAHRKSSDSPCAQVTGRASTLWKGDLQKLRLSRGFSLQAIWGSDALFEVRVISRPSSVGRPNGFLRRLLMRCCMAATLRWRYGLVALKAQLSWIKTAKTRLSPRRP